MVAAALALAAPALAQGTGSSCPDPGTAPTPVAVEVTAVPIVVTSTTDDYFVLYVTYDVGGKTVEIPVLVKLGEAGSTTLSERTRALAANHYRVEKYRVACPADVDGDGIDDLAELADSKGKNPVNPATALALSDGAVAVSDQATFDTLSVSIQSGTGLKFVVFGLNTDHPGVYFVNTSTHADHDAFMNALGLDPGAAGLLTGSVLCYPNLVASDGSRGVCYFDIGNLVPPSIVARAHTLMTTNMMLPLGDMLGYRLQNWLLPRSQDDLPLYRALRIPLVFDEDVLGETPFQALNPGVGFGRLKALDADDRPHPRDIALYEALPNELPRVAGIISTVPQTPLSHVNLRARQNRIPNAYIRKARDQSAITALLDSYVRYEVTKDSYTLRAATRTEVDQHYESARPAQAQTPERNLSVTAITPLSQVGFADWKAFGVKAANVAELGKLRFPAGTVPDGFAVPFHFYDRFMRETPLGQETLLGKGKWPAERKLTLAADTKLAAAVQAMLAHPVFRTDFAVQDEMLDDLRDAIKDAQSPQWIIDALTAMHATYPDGQSLRYRSSTNNEDLPGFNGAGLYDSYTQKPEETTEDGIDKSLKQVFASLWTFRAFTEREFHRIDHAKTAMGVLVHPNYTDEKVNGVAVSFNPTFSGSEGYYINSQVGEDLVTNPEAHSVPEELLLFQDSPLYQLGGYRVLATSNLAEPGQLLMSTAQLRQLRRHLETIHTHFKGLYKPAADKPFAMEIEFKITSANRLAIKQVRPWVFGVSGDRPPTPPTSLTLAAAPAPAEGGGAVTVTATLDRSAPANGATVTLAPSGDATRDTGGGGDYTLSSTVIAIDEGERTGAATLTIADDTEVDPGETIVLDAASTNPVLSSNTLTLVIADNDVTPPPLLPPPPPPPPPGGGGGGGFGPIGPAPSSDATLSGLSLSAGWLAFAPQTSAYAVEVPYAVGSVTVTPAVRNSGATVTVNGGEVSSGEASAPVALVAGEETLIEVVATAQNGTTTRTYTVTVTRGPAEVAFLPAASSALHGFVRVVNESDEAGEVRIRAFDDTGEEYGPLTLALEAGAAVQLGARDIESGNADKGLAGSTGPGQGRWRLVFESDLAFRALGYVRTRGAAGFPAAVHDAVAESRTEEGYRYEVAFFNPASNTNQASVLRLVNRSDTEASVTITGTDDAGDAGAEAVTLRLPAGAACTLSAGVLESGAWGDDAPGPGCGALTGTLGDGTGKWRLGVDAGQPLAVMSLMRSLEGHLTNLSTAPSGVERLWLLPSAANAVRSGFVRVVNEGDEAGTVTVRAFDDTGEAYGPLTLALEAGAAVQLSSHDLESGNPDKGLGGSTGPGQGRWRLAFESELGLRVLGYVRTRGASGFPAAVHDVVTESRTEEGYRYEVAFFNPASNTNQASVLRLVNRSDAEAAEVTVTGTDDAGREGDAGAEAVTLRLPAGASRILGAPALESGEGEGLDGALGDGAGKWRLGVDSDRPLAVMSLMRSLDGHLTNLSTAPPASR